MSSARTARLAREIKNFETKSPWGIKCTPEKEDIYDILLVNMQGPKGSPYEKGTFKLVIDIPKRYPFEPPLVKFVTPVYHPNIDKEGRICMDLLKMPPKGAWVPTITLENLLVSLQTLLANPNPHDPLMMDIANEYKLDIEKFNENARRCTEKYATGKQASEYPVLYIASPVYSAPAPSSGLLQLWPDQLVHLVGLPIPILWLQFKNVLAYQPTILQAMFAILQTMSVALLLQITSFLMRFGRHRALPFE